MSQDPQKTPQNKWILAALLIIGLAIALALWLSNGGDKQNGSPQGVSNAPSPEIALALDEAAQGELAAFRATAKGDRYPELKFTAETGEIVGFDHFAGKVTLVNFWATWCAPCRAEMPALDALQEKYAAQGFQVATINLDTGADGIEKAKKFMADAGLKNLPLHADPTFSAFEVLKKRGVALGLPATLLLSPRGDEWGVLAGPAEWNSDDAHHLIETALSFSKG